MILIKQTINVESKGERQHIEISRFKEAALHDVYLILKIQSKIYIQYQSKNIFFIRAAKISCARGALLKSNILFSMREQV